MFMGFNVRVECESFVKNCEDNEVSNLLATGSLVDNLQRPREKHMLEFEQSFARLYFANHFVTWPISEWLEKLFAWMFLKSTFFIS